MEHLWKIHGEAVYEPGYLKEQAKPIMVWCEEQGITLNAKARAKLTDTANWKRLRELLEHGHALMQIVGTEETADYNAFYDSVNKALKALKIKLSLTEKSAILNATSWYSEDAEKVIDKHIRMNSAEAATVAAQLGCNVADLGDFGLYKQADGSYLTFATNTELRDSESVPLKDSIHRYFRAEVKPHIKEAWINRDSFKIGYEINFNKYFYRHKPLRGLGEVADDILALERQADGLISDILGVPVAVLSEGK